MLQRSLELALGGSEISPAHGSLPRADRLTDLPQAVAFLDSSLPQFAHLWVAGLYLLRFGEDSNRFAKLPLVKGLLASL